MRKHPTSESGLFNPRFILGLLLCSAAAFLAVLSFAANPTSGTISPSGPVGPFTGNWVGTAPGGAADGPGTCIEGINCDTFALTISGNPADWAGKQVRVNINWLVPATDYDLYVYHGPVDATPDKSSGQGATTFETVVIDPSTEGTGLWTVQVVYFAANAADQYNGSAVVEASTQGGCAQAGTSAPRFQNYTPPAGSGLGGDAGEPTIGVNPDTGNVFYIAILQTLRINFDDCTSPAGNTWTNISFATTSANTLDPILITDQVTGRTFVSQLAGKASLMAYTDNEGGTDGQTLGDWTQSQGSGINSGVDHQNLGYGPFAPPLTRDPNVLVPYPNAVYYCSQDIAIAQCAVSADGGQTFGPAVPVWTAATCGGLHGHTKVSPVDGAAYVPNKGCGTNQAVARSLNNGVTWTVLPIPDSTLGDWDPSVGIGKNGTLYFGYADETGNAKIAVSRNRGASWEASQDVGCAFNVTETAFPAVVAGDDDRASFAFLGTPVSGNDAVWHLYVATTYDGGLTWKTVDATPNDPVQRGTICSGGISCGSDRNLLDFMDAEVDEEGRVLVAYADGCIGSCVQSPPNSFSALATIARQSGGKRLYAAFDPANPAVPGTPAVTGTRDPSGIVHLTWTEPDNGGSPITVYRVYRRTSNSGFSLVGTVTKTKYDDIDAASFPGTQFFYVVTAVNAVGESPFCAEIIPTVIPALDPCTLPGVLASNDISDGPPNTPAAPALDSKSVSVAEPYDPANPGANKLVFTLQTGGGAPLPPNAQWYIIWNRLALAGNGDDRNFVRMMTNAASTPSFKYGTISPASVNLPTEVGDADSGSYDPATGKITIIISNNKIENVGAGQTIGGLNSRVFSRGDACAAGQCLPVTQAASQDFSPEGSYTLVGNFFCRPNTAPIAEFTATPTSGDAPLLVNFDATGSSDTDTPPDTIVNYTFDFGDGAQESGTDPTVSHTYTDAGFYRARLLVADSRGKVSSNIAQVVIDVGLPLAKVESRKIHGAKGPFYVTLFDGANPTNRPEIECRTGGASNAYTLIYTFDAGRTITDPGTATTTQGTSNPPGAPALGPLPNQITVEVTGVTNRQHLIITLDDVHDDFGAILNNVDATLDVLIGDVTAERFVNSFDITQTKAQSGIPVALGNFRKDVTAEGFINSFDVTTVKSKSGTGLP
jgi:PKD repeat protein